MGDALDLMRRHVEALFTHNDARRLVAVNEPNGAPAPRLFLGRTAEGSAWWFRDDVDDDLAAELTALCRSQSPGLEFTQGSADVLIACLSRRAAVRKTWAGPAYHFPAALPTAETAVRVTPANAAALKPYFEEWLGDVSDGTPMAAVVEDGRAVSICCSVRVGSEAHEAGVETHPDFRRRGHGARATAAWAEAVRELDRIPLYSTSWENRASQALADQLGLIQFGADLHVT